MTPKSKSKGKLRRGIETILLLAGIGGVCVWIAATAAPIVSQDWGNWVFDRKLNGRSATVADYLRDRRDTIVENLASEWRALRGGGKKPAVVNGPLASRPPQNQLKERDLIGRLEIARLNLKTIVREGAQEDTLSIAAGHIPSTALPGQPGNVGVAGHRDTLFRSLKGIKNGDLIQFETLNGSYVYQVESTQIVKPTDVGVLKPADYSQLTLVTCYPFTYIGSAPDRFIVKARQMVASSVKPDLSGIPVTESAPSIPESSHAATVAVSVEDNSAAPAKFETKSIAAPKPHPDESQTIAGSGTGKVTFLVNNNHSRQLAPGISIGVTTVDPGFKRVDGWIWVMPDRRTVWIEHQPLRDPIVFYQDGKIRELVLTNVASNAATGYLLMPGND